MKRFSLAFQTPPCFHRLHEIWFSIIFLVCPNYWSNQRADDQPKHRYFRSCFGCLECRTNR